MSTPRLHITRRAHARLLAALDIANTLVSTDHARLDPALHGHADALRIYVDTWLRYPLQAALDSIEGKTDDYA